MLKLAVDVYYNNNTAKAIAILFKNWQDENPAQIISKSLSDIQPYEPGSFYKRELPCIMALLESIDINQLELIIIDGYVYLDDQNRLGLGGHLYQSLDKVVPIIGVAKTKFHNNTKNVKEIKRGLSKRPLFVSSIGMDIDSAADYIQSMSGDHRIPDLLKQLDRLTKE
ncbi:MAG TPA: endonuclease V [Flavisolibacter sp.]|nr:endonuclease V [Flavisolibacter sp.]